MDAIKEYIERSLGKGYTISEIKKMLISAGWSKADIERELDEVRPMPLSGEYRVAIKNVSERGKDIEVPLAVPSDGGAGLGIAAVVLAFFFFPLGLILGIITIAKKKHAILGGIAVFISMFQLGMFSLMFILPFAAMSQRVESCSFSGFDCISTSVSRQDMEVYLRSKYNEPVTIRSAYTSKCSGFPSFVTGNNSTPLANKRVFPGQEFKIEVGNCNFQGTWARIDLSLFISMQNYTFDNEHGIIEAKVKPHG